jgi:hypothetical protein
MQVVVHSGKEIEICTKTFSQNAELFNQKVGSTYGYHHVLDG